MRIKPFTFNSLCENTYLVWDTDSLETAVIDCGASTKAEEEELSAFIAANRLRLTFALQTHTHFDHIFGLPFIKEKYGIPPACHPLDERIYLAMPEMSAQFGFRIPKPLPIISATLAEGATCRLGQTEFEILHTPGHTPGGICFHIPKEKILFSGDTLFCGGIGRADLPGGDYKQEIESIKDKIMLLPDDTTVYPGHGPSTTIGWERQNNMYL